MRTRARATAGAAGVVASGASAAEFVLRVMAVPALASGAYLAGLAALAREGSRGANPSGANPSGANPSGANLSGAGGPSDEAPLLAVVIPAHDEEPGIAATVESVLAADYPADRRRVLVIADNCTDQTADRARRAGASVIERTDTARRSKGFALADVLPGVMDDADIDAVVIVDADTVVSSNLLEVAAHRLRGGADAVQVAYGVRNPNSSWRTRLMTIALACFHDVRSLGRERLRLSCGLRGNGMMFSRRALALVPHRAHGLVEDAEHGIALAEAGIRVEYAHEARVLGDMPATGPTARSQRDRWEQGRAALRRDAVPRLARRAITNVDPVCADLAVDLVVPPLGQLVAAQSAGLLAAAALTATRRRVLSRGAYGRRPLSPWLWGLALGGVAVHVWRGWRLSGTGRRGLRDLTMAPAYVIWKLVRRGAPSTTSNPIPDSGEVQRTWVRTTRSSSSVRPTGRAS